MAVWRDAQTDTDTQTNTRWEYVHTLTNKHSDTHIHTHILREAAVWWTALAFGRRHDKVVEESRREEASDTLDREREWWSEMKRVERKKRGKCERSLPLGLWPSVCFSGYLPLHCLPAENEAMCWEGGGVGLVRVRLWISKGKGGGREGEERRMEVLFITLLGEWDWARVCVCTCVCMCLCVCAFVCMLRSRDLFATAKVWRFAGRSVLIVSDRFEIFSSQVFSWYWPSDLTPKQHLFQKLHL